MTGLAAPFISRRTLLSGAAALAASATLTRGSAEAAAKELHIMMAGGSWKILWGGG